MEGYRAWLIILHYREEEATEMRHFRLKHRARMELQSAETSRGSFLHQPEWMSRTLFCERRREQGKTGMLRDGMQVSSV